MHEAVGATDMPAEYVGHVVANPRAELPVNNAKYVRNCTELHMAKRNIEFLWGFQQFVNLEELWLNNNKIRALDHLEANFRLRKVYAHNNLITTVKDTVQHCKFLNTLVLANNRITDMKATIDALATFQYLHELELLGNPLAEEPGYRLYAIYKLPSLHVFDRHVVTDVERRAAAKKFAKKKGAGTKAPPKKVVLPTDKKPLTKLEKDLARNVAQLKREMKEKELADLEAAYAAGARKETKTLAPVQSAAMSMSRTLLSESAKAGAGEGSGEAAPAAGLDEWEIIRISHLFDELDKDNSGSLSKDEFREGIEAARDMGKKLMITTNDMLERYFSAMDKDGDETVGLREFVAALQGELYDEDGNLMPALKWDNLGQDEALKRSDFFFKQAQEVQARLLPMPADDPRRRKLEQEAFRLTDKAARLADVAAQTKADRAPKAARKTELPPRGDYITFISNVRQRRDPAKDAETTAIDSGSDSDTDDEEDKAGSTVKWSTMRAARRSRKPRKVMSSSVVL